MLNTLRIFVAIGFIFGLMVPSYAMTPEEYCDIHEESGAPGTCDVKDNCAVLTTNLGTEEYKLCSDGGCELITDVEKCSE